MASCHAAFAYVGAGRELVARLKYRNNRSALRWMAAQMAARVKTSSCRAALVTWAPTTPAHRRERGFDHAELLARGVAQRLALPVRPLLARCPGPPQTGRSRAERARGPHFAPSPWLARQAARNGTTGVVRPVLLVDDVVTTGATLTSAARVLTAAGIADVVAVVAARTP